MVIKLFMQFDTMQCSRSTTYRTALITPRIFMLNSWSEISTASVRDSTVKQCCLDWITSSKGLMVISTSESFRVRIDGVPDNNCC